MLEGYSQAGGAQQPPGAPGALSISEMEIFLIVLSPEGRLLLLNPFEEMMQRHVGGIFPAGRLRSSRPRRVLCLFPCVFFFAKVINTRQS